MLLLALAGTTYQGVATALERRRWPHPGHLVDVGGHQLHLQCEGQGTPTVVLEAPATAMSSVWAWVQQDVAKTTRVCSYDRAGLGWSEAGDTSFTPDEVPTQLNVLLQRAGEQGPFVIAGAELGAAYALLYASRFPAETAALVLIDTPPQPGSGPGSHSAKFLSVSPWLARVGVLRATRSLSSGATGLPPAAAAALTMFLNRPDHLTRAAAELARWDDAVTMANTATQRQAMAVTQVLAGEPDGAALLANRRNAEDVVSAIARAVKSVRSRTPG